MQWNFLEWPTLWGCNQGMGHLPNPGHFLVVAEWLGFLMSQHTGARPSPELASCMLLPLGPQAP